MKRHWIILIIFISANAFAASWVVRTNDAPIFAEPNFNSKVVGRVTANKPVFSEGPAIRGFVKLKTKSGRALYMQVGDLEDLSKDLSTTEGEPASASESASDTTRNDFPLFTYDLGFSAGSYGGRNYSELNLGLNTFFMEWLAWRNAVFSRFTEPENIYGLDSSGRLYWRPQLGFLGFTLFGGPGYRFVSKGLNAPFAEAGLIIRLAGFSLGGGVKTLFNTMVDSRSANDTSYFILLSGGGSL